MFGLLDRASRDDVVRLRKRVKLVPLYLSPRAGPRNGSHASVLWWPFDGAPRLASLAGRTWSGLAGYSRRYRWFCCLLSVSYTVFSALILLFVSLPICFSAERTSPIPMATEIETKAPAAKETFHFINEPAEAINEALTGLTYLNPSLSYNADYKIVYRNDLATFSESHVTTIGFSGGGHEPMFGGFVGPSFLSAYVSGNIFASPTAAQIFEAIKMCQPKGGGSMGTLIVCGNYTGDILNAGLAITRAQAAGYKVHFVPVGDDVAVGRKKGGKVGRRGLSGHLIALKSVCALAQRGESLQRVAEVMEYIAANVGTVGVAFDR